MIIQEWLDDKGERLGMIAVTFVTKDGPDDTTLVKFTSARDIESAEITDDGGEIRIVLSGPMIAGAVVA